MNEFEHVGVVLETTTRNAQQIDKLQGAVSKLQAAINSATKATEASNRVQAQQARVIDATTSATKRLNAEAARTTQLSGRPNSSLASDPNEFFRQATRQTQQQSALLRQVAAVQRQASALSAGGGVIGNVGLSRGGQDLDGLIARVQKTTDVVKTGVPPLIGYGENVEKFGARVRRQTSIIDRWTQSLITLHFTMRAMRFVAIQFNASVERLAIKPETAEQAQQLSNRFREMKETAQGVADVLVSDLLPVLNRLTGGTNSLAKLLETPGLGSGVLIARKLLTGRSITDEAAFKAAPKKELENFAKLSQEMNQDILESTAKRTQLEADLTTAQRVAEENDYHARVRNIRTIALNSTAERNALLEQAAKAHQARLLAIEVEGARKAAKEAKEAADAAKNLDLQELDAQFNRHSMEGGNPAEREFALMALNQERERQSHEANLEAINNLTQISVQKRHEMIEQAERIHQTNITAIQMAAMERQRAMMKTMLGVAQDTFGNMASAAAVFAGEGSTAFKAFATAQAVMSTAIGAIGAFSQASAAFPPPFGQIIGGVAAAAVVAAGAAQIAKINGAFADGGYTGDGGRFEPAGIVHRGEVVIPAPTVRAHGGPQAFAGYFGGRMPGYAGGGIGGYAPASVSRAPSKPMGGGNFSFAFMERRDRNAEREAMERDGYTVLIDRMRRRGNVVKA